MTAPRTSTATGAALPRATRRTPAPRQPSAAGAARTPAPASEPSPPPSAPPEHPGPSRIVVDAVLPSVDGGRFPAKRALGEALEVTAHVFTDGHDQPRVMLEWWAEGAPEDQHHWQPMVLRWNDEWLARFTPPALGMYRYTVWAWVDRFESWRAELERRQDADDLGVAARVGAAEITVSARLAEQAGMQADAQALHAWAAALEAAGQATPEPAAAAQTKALALDAEHAAIARRHPERRWQARFGAELPLLVDRERARFSTWYELFPRSAGDSEGAHGTLADVVRRLPLIAQMGFDVLYLPPIHPIGRAQRKGRNNAVVAEDGDVGSPWAIGAAEGGHDAILPALGTRQDLRALIEAARGHGMEVALDIAFQCAPDHPWVEQHPQWFRRRPDGSVQYAENPPKKYQDIYPFDFESEDWRGLWVALRDVMAHWVAEGVHIFRVDNPHTKAFAFWEWAIADLRRTHPQLIFLAEAFTRPKVMHRLAKLGFDQSYTYFTWRNTKAELTEYFTELSQGPGREYFRPNVWPNTPDILHAALQGGLEPVFKSRLVLAATLAASYGIYGPAFELMEHRPRGPGSEEYLDSEKYQLRHWDWHPGHGIRPFIARVNRIRHANPALQQDHDLRFLPVDNPQLIAYLKTAPAAPDDPAAEPNRVLTVVNLDPEHPQTGWLELAPHELGLAPERPMQLHDLLSDQHFTWHGGRHFVRLDPHAVPAHVMRVSQRRRDEHEFDYYR